VESIKKEKNRNYKFDFFVEENGSFHFIFGEKYKANLIFFVEENRGKF
jgi:hypothetical protein